MLGGGYIEWLGKKSLIARYSNKDQTKFKEETVRLSFIPGRGSSKCHSPKGKGLSLSSHPSFNDLLTSHLASLLSSGGKLCISGERKINVHYLLKGPRN